MSVPRRYPKYSLERIDCILWHCWDVNNNDNHLIKGALSRYLTLLYKKLEGVFESVEFQN